MRETPVWPISQMHRAFIINDEEIAEQMALALADRRIEFHFKPDGASTIFTLPYAKTAFDQFVQIYCDRLQQELMLREDVAQHPKAWQEMKPLDTRPGYEIWEVTGPVEAVLDTTAWMLQTDRAHPRSHHQYLQLEYFETRHEDFTPNSALARLSKSLKREAPTS